MAPVTFTPPFGTPRQLASEQKSRSRVTKSAIGGSLPVITMWNGVYSDEEMDDWEAILARDAHLSLPPTLRYTPTVRFRPPSLYNFVKELARACGLWCEATAPEARPRPAPVIKVSTDAGRTPEAALTFAPFARSGEIWA